MQARRGARFLAPIALIAAVVGVYVIVHGQLGRTHASATTNAPSSVRTTTARPASTTSGSSRTPRTYTVKANDTYSSIAEKTGVSVAELEALNPNVSANSLHPGEHIVVHRP
jgi:LysM repeat protein